MTAGLQSPVALLVGSGLLVLLVVAVRRRRQRDLPWAAEALWRAVPRVGLLHPVRLGDAVRLLALALVVVALAEPWHGRRRVHREVETVDLVLVLDCSSSMATPLGVDGTRRFDSARRVLREFVEQRSTDRIALIGFARAPRLLCPRTLDHALLLDLLEATEPVPARSEDDRTAIGAALAAAARALEDSAARSRVVVLLTDGENNVSRIRPGEGAAWCARSGARIHAVEVVGRETTPGTSQLLRTVASATGGRSFRAGDERALAEAYRSIDTLERSRVRVWTDVAREPTFAWLAVPALVLLSGWILLQDRYWRRIP